ncbi:UNVERIFIED_CONTAM: Copia protein [Sesamum angustifolium]|uniref:Copia protein n=1 Tax=Sesamum angustifolium TaxID=2727405 RepID=A0AAW2LWA8_9LAMI
MSPSTLKEFQSFPSSLKLRLSGHTPASITPKITSFPYCEAGHNRVTGFRVERFGAQRFQGIDCKGVPMDVASEDLGHEGFVQLISVLYFGATVCELLWISYLLQDFGIPLHSPIPLFCDNKAALHIMANPVFHERTKHLDIDCHIVRNQYKLGFVAPSFVRGKEQIADIFTKSLPASTFLFSCPSWPCFPLIQVHLCGGVLEYKLLKQPKVVIMMLKLQFVFWMLDERRSVFSL